MCRLCAFILSVCLLIAIVGCQASNNNLSNSNLLSSSSTITNPTLIDIMLLPTVVPPTTMADNVVYLPSIWDDFNSPYTTEEMCANTNAIVKGKITGASFYARNFLPSDKPEEEWDHVIICTTYTLEILHAYWGGISGTVTYDVASGYPGHFLDEQMALVKKYGLGGINTNHGMVYPELDKEYMFMLNISEDGKIGIVTIDQYLFEINESEVVTDPTVPSYKSILDYLSNNADNSINTND